MNDNPYQIMIDVQECHLAYTMYSIVFPLAPRTAMVNVSF